MFHNNYLVFVLKPLFVLLILLLIFANTIVLALPTIMQYNSISSNTNNSIDVDDVVKTIVRKLNLNINDPRTYYELYISGRILKIKCDSKEFSFLQGVNPEDLVFAYFDGMNWHILPARIFIDKASSNITTVYIVPKKINPNTTILLKLPSKYPVRTNPSKNIPEFARASRSYMLSLYKDRIGVLGYIYVFIGGSVKWAMPSILLTPQFTHYSVNDVFSASEPPKLIEYMRRIGYSDKEIYQVFEEVLRGRLSVGKDLFVRIEWEEPIPDGGGGSPGYAYNLMEIRLPPWESMNKNDYKLISSNSSFTKKLYIIDPEVNDLKWKTLELTITIYFKQQEPVMRDLKVILENQDYGYNYDNQYVIEGDKVNVITLSYTPSAYGTDCKYLYLTLSITDIPPDSDEEWYVRIIPTVFIIWDTQYLNELLKPIRIDILPKSSFQVMLTDNLRSTSRILYLPSLELVSIPNPDDTVYTQIKATITSAPPNVFPLLVTISIGGIVWDSEIFYDVYEDKYFDIWPMNKEIISMSSYQEGIPVSIEVESLSDKDIGYSTIKLELSLVEPLIVYTKPMYMIHDEAYNDIFLFTATRSSNDPKWSQLLYFKQGEDIFLYGKESFETSPPKIYVKNINMIFSKKGEIYIGGSENYRDYQLAINTSSIDHYWVQFDDAFREIVNAQLDYVVLKIKLLDSLVLLPTTTISTYKFYLNSPLPELPEIPPPLALLLGVISRIVPIFRLIGEAINSYEVIKYCYDYIRIESCDKISVIKDYQDNTIIIKWDHGAFSRGDFAGLIYIYDVYNSSQQISNPRIKFIIEYKIRDTGVTITYDYVVRG